MVQFPVFTYNKKYATVNIPFEQHQFLQLTFLIQFPPYYDIQQKLLVLYYEAPWSIRRSQSLSQTVAFPRYPRDQLGFLSVYQHLPTI